MKLTKADIQDVMERERAWCAMPRTMQEEQEDVAALRARAYPRLQVPAPPAAVQTLIETTLQELDESSRRAHTRRARVPGSFTPQPRSIREDSPSVGATGSAGTDMTLPSDWTQESNGAFTHPQHGAMHVHQNGTWTHLRGGKIAKRGSGQQSLTEYLKNLAPGNEGPCGTAAEAHELLHRALVGTPLQEARPDGVHVQMAKALGHSGAVPQEDDGVDGKPIDDVHTRLANAIRSR